jgi:hypothetical protein
MRENIDPDILLIFFAAQCNIIKTISRCNQRNAVSFVRLRRANLAAVVLQSKAKLELEAGALSEAILVLSPQAHLFISR